MLSNAQRSRMYRRRVIELLGGKCSRCGFLDIRALEIDHVNGDGYKDTSRTNPLDILRRVKEDMRNGERRFQVLCANCHSIKNAENREYLPIHKRSGA